MKCPKCHYVSHDYLDACRKCGIDLVTFKQDIGLVVLQPGALDLSLVLGGAGVDDLFESIAEEDTMHASDDDFDISLDDYLEEVVSAGPPPANDVSASPETQDTTASLQLDISHSDFVHLTSAATPEAEGNDAARAESVDETVRVTDISSTMAALPLQDVVLADRTPAAAEPDPAVVDPTLPTMQLSYAAVDDAVLTPEVRESSASDIADMAEPALTTLDAPHLQDMELLPSFKDEWAPLTVESMPEDMLTSLDIFTLEDLEETMPPGPLMLELDASVLPVDEVELLLDLDNLEFDDDKPAH
jgi:hypothetical protein